MPTADWLLMWVLNSHMLMSAKFAIHGSGVPLASSSAAQTWSRPDFTAHDPSERLRHVDRYVAITSAVTFQFTRSRGYFREEVFPLFFSFCASISRVGVPSHEIES